MLIVVLLNTILIFMITCKVFGVNLITYFGYQRKPSQVADRHPDGVVEHVSTPLSQVEVERQAWNDSFDARIRQLKDELASSHPVVTRMDSVAEEMHPLVKNIPHETQYISRYADRDEVSE